MFKNVSPTNCWEWHSQILTVCQGLPESDNWIGNSIIIASCFAMKYGVPAFQDMSSLILLLTVIFEFDEQN